MIEDSFQRNYLTGVSNTRCGQILMAPKDSFHAFKVEQKIFDESVHRTQYLGWNLDYCEYLETLTISSASV